jgi:hypothetical protein
MNIRTWGATPSGVQGGSCPHPRIVRRISLGLAGGRDAHIVEGGITLRKPGSRVTGFALLPTGEGMTKRVTRRLPSPLRPRPNTSAEVAVRCVGLLRGGVSVQWPAAIPRPRTPR